MVLSKFKKIGFFFMLLIAFAVEGKGQILVTPTINLNVGGAIYDVVDNPFHDCFIIVGSFTSVNGIPANKIAFLDKTNLSVKTNSWFIPISSIDGDIYSVEFTSTFNIMTSEHTHHLYLGGNFNSVTSSNGTFARNGLVKLTSTQLFSTIQNYIIAPWNAQLDIGPGIDKRINDMQLSNDTLFFTGDFTQVNGGVGPDTERFAGVAAVKITTNAHLLMFNSVSNTTSGVKKILWLENKLYVAGNVTDPYSGGDFAGLFRLNIDGTRDISYPAQDQAVVSVCGCLGGFDTDMALIGDSLIVTQFDLTDDSFSRDGETVFHNINPLPGTTYYSSNIYTRQTSLATYKNYSFITRDGTYDDVMSFPKPELYTVISDNQPITEMPFLASFNCEFTDFMIEHVWVVDNMLFVSNANMNMAGDFLNPIYSRTGVAVFCLEPDDAKNFTSLDTAVCTSQIVPYTIPSVEFANGYIWEYTGQGADIGNSGIENLKDTIFSVFANSIDVKFLPNATSGEIKVTPFSNYNGQLVQPNALIVSNTVSANIVVSQLPTINAGADTIINCYVDAINLYGSSTSPGVTYEWIDPSYALGQFYLTNEGGDYVFRVTSPAGCIIIDTVNVAMDTIAPIAIPPSGIYELTCAEPVKDFLGSTSTPNTVLCWSNMVDTIFANPLSISSTGPYQFIAIDTLNGCTGVAPIFVAANIAQPTISLPDYPITTGAIDTIYCNPNFVNLVCASSTPNTDVSWINSDTTLFYGDTMSVTSAGIYDVYAVDNSNGCSNTLSIFITSFQNIPGIGITGDTILNCSVDSLSLFGSSLSVGSTIEWSGIFVPVSTNPLTVHDAGTYYFTVTNPDNGCVSSDSVIVLETNEINVSAGNDLLVCDQSLVNLSATYSGTITGINYLWNTGSTSSNEIYTAGNSAYATVQVFGDNSCYGLDTVYLNLPPNPVINFQGFKPCDNAASGQIVATPVSGLAPFQYSIDGGTTYQTSPVFGGLYLGTYPIWVKDSVDCDYQFQAIIDGNSSLPEPKFLFSTYNFESDTVTIIDVSNPPTDSTVWEFPSELIVLDYNELSPTILLPDTGVFQITMKAYFGTCLVELTKPIYAALFDSTEANHYNQNGIKSIQLYPNPTSGNFIVTVEFYKSQRSAMVVQDMIGNSYVYNEYDETLTISQDIFLDLSVLDGTYVLKLISEFDSAYITFILAR